VKKHSDLLVVLAALFCVSLVVSNIIAGKLWETRLAVLTAGVLLFPIVYIIGDVVPEVYGLATARRVIWLGFFANLFAVVFFLITLKLPYPEFWTNQDAFTTVLGFTPRLLLASFAGYLVGTNANAWVMVSMKKLTKGRWLWTRTISSTLVGETLDSLLFMTIAFYGIVPNEALPGMILAQTLFKTGYEIVVTPVTYYVVSLAKKYEGVTS